MQSDEAHSFIFESGDARTADKLMVLIHGSGVVRAGQWARRLVSFTFHTNAASHFNSSNILHARLIINDCLDSGTQLPFIKRSFEVYNIQCQNKMHAINNPQLLILSFTEQLWCPGPQYQQEQ